MTNFDFERYTLGLTPQREVPGLLPPSDNRPADIFLHEWSAGRSTGHNFTAINARQAANIEGCPKDGAHAVNHAVAMKLHR